MSSTLPKLDDWKAPWEVDSTGTEVPSEEQKIDPARLKKYLHGLLTDKERLQTTVTTVTGERDELQKSVEAKAREGETADQAKQREYEQAIEKAKAEAKAEGELQALRLDIALGVEGITPAQARKLAARITGKDRESLEADAKALAEDFGIGKTADADSEDSALPGRPRRPRATGDPNPLDDSKLPDPSDRDAIDKLFPRR